MIQPSHLLVLAQPGFVAGQVDSALDTSARVNISRGLARVLGLVAAIRP